MVRSRPSVYSQGQDTPTIAIEILVGVLVALALLLLGVPGLSLIFRLGALALLAGLAALNLAVLLGLFDRLSTRRMERRYTRRLNRSSLPADLVSLLRETEEVVLENRQKTLYNVARRIAQPAGREHEMEARMQEIRGDFVFLREFVESAERWEKFPFVQLVRRVGDLFRLLDPVLEECYDLAGVSPVDEETQGQWEYFKEEYNQLRVRWKAYFDRVPKKVGLHVRLMGEPARSLLSPARFE